MMVFLFFWDRNPDRLRRQLTLSLPDKFIGCVYYNLLTQFDKSGKNNIQICIPAGLDYSLFAEAIPDWFPTQKQ